jgi:hypothetical protein
MLLLYRLCVAETKGGNRPFARVKIMLRILRKIFFNVEGWGGVPPLTLTLQVTPAYLSKLVGHLEAAE